MDRSTLLSAKVVGTVVAMGAIVGLAAYLLGAASTGDQPHSGGNTRATATPLQRGNSTDALHSADKLEAPVGQARAASVKDEIRDTKNLRTTLDKLRALPDPTGETSFLLGRAVMECVTYQGYMLEGRHKSLQNATNMALREVRAKLIAERTSRCSTFDRVDDGAVLMLQLRDHAVAMKHPAAQSIGLTGIMHFDGTEVSDAKALALLTRSSDPHLLEAIGVYLHERNMSVLKPDEGIRSQYGQAAWMLLQCDLGQDCSSKSPLMITSAL
jgi:hypothetical protein